MNRKKKTIVFISLLISCCLFLNSKVEAISKSPVKPYTIDHDTDKKKAKKWAEKEYESWKKTLTSEEKKSLQKLLQSPREKEEDNLNNINHQLKVYGGDLSTRPIDTFKENKKLEDHVNRISQAINRKEGKLEKPLIVYKNETLHEVLHTNDEYFRNLDQTLNIQKVRQLKKDFSAGLHSEFRIFDLFEDPKQDEMIKWKIELPAGTPTGLITEDRIVIDKDSAFKVNDITIIIQKGKQLIRVDAKLVPKETVTHEIKPLTDQLHQNFISHLELPSDKKFIDFKLTGSASLFIAKKLPLLINKFFANIDYTLIKETLQFMSEEEGYITLTDQALYTLPTVYEPNEPTLKKAIDRMYSVGFYNQRNRTLSVHVPEDMEKKLEGRSHTLFHEFGHAVDFYCAQRFQLKKSEISDTSQFAKIFKKEGKKLTKYASTNPSEFFAEAFWLMHTKNEKNVQIKAPNTYKFIKSILKFNAEHEKHLFEIAS